MYCPEDYFTPKMLEEAFYKSLSRKGVREPVFQSAHVESSKIHAAHLENVLRLSATIFLHHFIRANRDNIRACSVTAPMVLRVDPWLTMEGDRQVTTLPTDKAQCDRLRKQVERGFVAIDQELWVIDSGVIEQAALSEAVHMRIAKLTKNFDGWSICFPNRLHPSDVGETMNLMASNMHLMNAATPIGQRLGRPSKVESVARFIEETWPDGTSNLNRGAMLSDIEKGLGTRVSSSTLSNALRAKRVQ